MQKRTSPIKFAHLAEKSENGSTSNLSTKVWAVAFNPAGDRLATGSSDGVLRMFDAAGQRRWEVGDLASVETLAFSPCGAVVAAGTWTGLLGLYHAETGRLACEVESERPR